MKLTLFKRLIILLSFITLAACNTEVRRIVHKAPGDINPDFKESPDADFEAQAQFDKFNIENLNSIVESGDVQKILDQIIKPLRAEVFNPKKEIDPNFVEKQDFADLLRVYNQAIIKTYNSQPQLLESNKILEDYEALLNYNCNSKLEGGCPMVQIMRVDPSSRSVAKIIASKKQDVFAYYRSLSIAMDLSNRTSDDELNFMYIKRAQEFGQAMQAKPDEFPQFELTRLSRVFHNILIDFKGADPNSSEYKEFMDNFNPWEYSRHNSNLFKDSAKHLLDQAARFFMYEDEKLNESLLATIKQIQLQNTDKENLGVNAIIEDMKSDPKLSRIIDNLGLSTDFAPDEYYYIVDRLFNDHFTTDEATKIWSNTKKDKQKMLTLVRNYVQLQVAYMIIRTNRTMKQFFDNSERYADSFELLRRAVNETLNLHTQWDNLINNRIKRLRTFLDRQFKTFSSQSSTASTDEYNKLDKTFEGLTQNIKYLAVYPNMMMLAYLMAKENFRGVIQTFWGTFTVDPALIITTFLDRGLDPWFSFGNNKIGLNRMQFLYAFHFALTTEIFGTFSSNKRIPINYKTFFTAIIEKYFQKEFSGENGLKDSLSKFKAFTNQKSRQYNDLVRACAVERMLQTQEQEIYKTRGLMASLPRNLELYTEIDTLTEYIAMGTLTTNDSYIYLVNELYRGRNVVSNLKEMRTTLHKKLIYIEQMIEMVIDYDPSAKTDLEDLLTEVKSTKMDYIKNVYDLHRRVDGCGKIFLQREFNLQHQIIRHERTYLGQVYDDILQLRIIEEKKNLNGLEESDLNEKVTSLKETYPSVESWTALSDEDYTSQKNAILNNELYKLKDADFPEDIRNGGFRGKISAKNYEYRKFDMLVRFKRYLKEIYPLLTVNLPDMDAWGPLTTADMQVIRFDPTVSPSERKEDFIRRGLGAMMSEVKWYTQTTNNFFLLSKSYYLTEMYKMSPISLVEDGCADSPGDSDKCINVTADDVIKDAFSSLKLVNLDELELQNLEWTGRSNMHPEQNFLDQLVMEKQSKRKLPLFEKVFHYVMSDSDADEYPKTTTLWFDEAKEYYETETSLINFFFQPSENVKNKIKASYKPLALTYAKKGYNFLKTLDRYRVNPEYQIERFYIRNDNFIDGVTEILDIDGSNKEAMIYVSETKLNEFKGKISLFNDSTEGQFLPTEYGGKLAE